MLAGTREFWLFLDLDFVFVLILSSVVVFSSKLRRMNRCFQDIKLINLRRTLFTLFTSIHTDCTQGGKKGVDSSGEDYPVFDHTGIPSYIHIFTAIRMGLLGDRCFGLRA
jgi:hypothetical protein